MSFEISDVWKTPAAAIASVVDSPLQREVMLLRDGMNAGFSDQIHQITNNPILGGLEIAAGIAIGGAALLGRRYWIPCALATTGLGLVMAHDSFKRIGITARAMADAWSHPENFD